MSQPFNPTPDQQRALALDRGKLVIAGAGSGKTTVMAHRYLALLEQQDLQPRDILATTFARKAAASLKARIHSLLQERIRQDSAHAATWRQRRDAMQHARIQTLHSFCAGLVRAYPLESGVDPDVAVSELASRERERRVRWMLRDRNANGDPDLAALAGLLGERPLAEIEALVIRIVVEEDLREAIARVDDNPEAADTFLREQAAAIRAQLVPDGVYKSLAKTLDRPFDHRQLLGALQLAARLASRILNAEPQPATRLSFDDVERRALRLLEGDSTVADEIRTSIKALLVDEFQDTSSVQWRLIQALIRDSRGGQASRKAFFVGDEKQAIYGFRGANVTVVHRGRELSGEGTDRLDLVDLRDNFRSVRPLLERLNPVLRRLLQDRHEGVASQAFHAEPQDLQARKPVRAGDRHRFVVAPVIGGTEEWIEHTVRWVEAVRGMTGENDELPVPGASQVEGTGDASPDGEGLGPDVAGETSSETRIYDYSDIAILVRSRTHLPELELALQAHGVPYIVHGGRGFLAQPEVRDLIHPIAALADPRDRASLVAVLRGPLIGLPDTAVAALFDGPRDPLTTWQAVVDRDDREGLLDALDDEDRRALQRGWHHWQALQRSAGHLDPVAWLRGALDRAGAWAASAVGRRGEQRLANQHRFLDLLRDWIAEDGPALRALNHRIARELDQPEDDSEADIRGGQGVNILTVHAAKGLEFPVVLLPLAATGGGGRSSGPPTAGNLLVPDTHPLAPLTRPSLTLIDKATRAAGSTTFHDHLQQLFRPAEEDAEERRILYVAATRAEERLIVLPQVLPNSTNGANKGTPSLLWLRACGLAYDKEEGELHVPEDATCDVIPVWGEEVPVTPLHAPPPLDAARFAPVHPDPDAAPHVLLAPSAPRRALVLPLEAFAGWVAQPDERRTRRLLQFGGEEDRDRPFSGGDTGTEPRSTSSGEGEGGVFGNLTGEGVAGSGERMGVPSLADVPMHAGTLLHDASERFGPGVTWRDAEAWVDARIAGLPDLLREPVHERTRRLIDAAAGMDWALADGPLRREWPLLLRLGPVTLRGRIDLAWPQATPPLAVDLKTNDVLPEEVDATLSAAGYHHQVRLYALALLLARGLDHAEGRLRFLPHGIDRPFPVNAADKAEYMRHAERLLAWVRDHMPDPHGPYTLEDTR